LSSTVRIEDRIMITPLETVSPAAEARDSRGRFKQGNKGGPGNPFLRRIGELRRTVLNFAAQDDMEQAALVLKELAMAGDLAAIKLLFEYVLGKPMETVESDYLGMAEGRKLQQQSRPPLSAPTVREGQAAQIACEVTKAARPSIAEQEQHKPRPAGERKLEECDRGRKVTANRQTKELAPSPNRRNGTRSWDGPKPNGRNGPGPAHFSSNSSVTCLPSTGPRRPP
jgi:hypothetical protein